MKNIKKNRKKILVDMTVSILHHGHIRLLKKASKLGKVIVALTRDKEVKKYKGYTPEIKFKHRKEILMSIKYVDKVIPSNFKITNKFIQNNKVDLAIHGSDYSGDKSQKKIKIFKRTKDISSTKLRKKIHGNIKLLKNGKS